LGTVRWRWCWCWWWWWWWLFGRSRCHGCWRFSARRARWRISTIWMPMLSRSPRCREVGVVTRACHDANGGEHQCGGPRATLTAAWPNWAKIFFDNKGVAAKETDRLPTQMTNLCGTGHRPLGDRNRACLQWVAQTVSTTMKLVRTSTRRLSACGGVWAAFHPMSVRVAAGPRRSPCRASGAARRHHSQGPRVRRAPRRHVRTFDFTG
jgi:hypothetical protein